MKNKYDFLIVGAGISGCFLAYQLTKSDYNVLMIDKEDHIGGTCYSRQIEGIEVHEYGPHIYRTDNLENYKFLDKYADFNNFINEPVAKYHNELYNMPFNMNTFNRIWSDVITPADASRRIQEEIEKEGLTDSEITNLETKAISLIGRTIYDKLIRGYTEKQWGAPCSELPESIITVLPVRFTYNNNYFSQKYQGIPKNGYTGMLQNMLSAIEQHPGSLTIRYKYLISDINDPIFKEVDKVIYTGRIDHLFNYKYGKLPYRGAMFKHIIENVNNYQGVAVMNFTDKETQYVRRTEHKHFTFGDDRNITVLSEEYSTDATDSIDMCYYPIDNLENNKLQQKYLKELPDNFYTCGTRGDYQNYTMDSAIERCKQLLNSLNICCFMN